MAVTVEAQIFSALAGAIDAFASISRLPIAIPGIPYIPAPGAPYLRPWHLPAPTVSTDWANSNTYVGVFQIDVFWPAAQGVKAAMLAAAQVVDFFISRQFQSTVGDQSVVVRVQSPPYLGPALEEPGWLQIPVSVGYIVFAQASGIVVEALGSVESADSAAFAGTLA